MIVFLDLDRTLFRTDAFGEVIWQYVHGLYPEVDPQACYENRDDYFRSVGDMYYHDIGQQLSDMGLDPETVYSQLAVSELADGRCEFDGVKDLIDSLRERTDVTVLTFGDDAYQRFKVQLCPSLQGLPVVTTLEPKARLLAHVEGSYCVVDDKPIGNELPGDARFIQVSLEGKEVDGEALWPVFFALTDVKEYFDKTLA